MNTQEIRFVVTTNGKEITHIGKSVIYHPPVNYTGKGTKWFDDSRLVRKGRSDKDKCIEAHKDAYGVWPHGAPVKCWIGEDGELCIAYEDGNWYHYKVENEEIAWWQI